ncbi:hypothetical protein [Edaphobacter aggregans]|uniref:hypothetical protein n=1 Tax=Edaphobacter aggregans TaxID=570835 RepID=UPI0012FCB9C9|nr:hypothetical protein [Edaphobacter aggregans]
MPHDIRRSCSILATSAAFFFVPLGSVPVRSQQLIAITSSRSAAEELPDAPKQQQQTPSAAGAQLVPPTTPDAGGPQQTKRILGIMPNFSSVSADAKLPPQTPKDKFIIAAKNSFDYSSFVMAAVQAGFSMNSNSYPQFRQGAVGYGRYYWHTLLDTAGENFMVSGLGPVAFRQDNRFYTLGHGSFRKRVFYAATRVLVTRTDDGGSAPNYSEIIGAGAAAGVSTLYYPSEYRTWTKVGQKWLTSCIIDSASYAFKEYWPDINHKVFHTK